MIQQIKQSSVKCLHDTDGGDDISDDMVLASPEMAELEKEGAGDSVDMLLYTLYSGCLRDYFITGACDITLIYD